MTPSVATDDLSTVTTAVIVIVVLLCVTLAMVLLGIVLFLTLKGKTISDNQPAQVTAVETIYDEIDEGQTGTGVALRSVGKLQAITDPDPHYVEMDDSEGALHYAANAAYGATTIPSSDDAPNPYEIPTPTCNVEITTTTLTCTS